MKKFDFLIIGNGIAGVTAVETLRQKNPTATIGIITDEELPLYSKVLLPNYVKGAVPEEKVFLRKFDWYKTNNFELIFNHVNKVLPEKKIVQLKNRDELEYGKLLVASGGLAKPVGEAAEKLAGIFPFHTFEDAHAIKQWMDYGVKKPVIIGSSFIALEFVGILNHYQTPGTLILRGPHIWPKFLESQAAKILEDKIEAAGFTIIRDSQIKKIHGEQKVTNVETDDGKKFETGFVGLGTGIIPNFEFLPKNLVGQGVRANEFLEVAPDIFTAGDIAEFFDVRLNRHHMVGNWFHGLASGKRAALNMLDEHLPYNEITSYGLTVLGNHIAFVGEVNKHEQTEVVSKIDIAAGKYEGYFVENNKLIGAILINNREKRPTIIEKIKLGDSIKNIELK